jgi:hypothetical protein
MLASIVRKAGPAVMTQSPCYFEMSRKWLLLRIHPLRYAISALIYVVRDMPEFVLQILLLIIDQDKAKFHNV